MTEDMLVGEDNAQLVIELKLCKLLLGLEEELRDESSVVSGL